MDEWKETNRARSRTTSEDDYINYINGALGNSAEAHILEYIRIMCATKHGFFERVFKVAFEGFYSQTNQVRKDLGSLSSSFIMAERAITKQKKSQTKFQEVYKGVILRGLKIASKFHNVDDLIEEYKEENND